MATNCKIGPCEVMLHAYGTTYGKYSMYLSTYITCYACILADSGTMHPYLPKYLIPWQERPASIGYRRRQAVACLFDRKRPHPQLHAYISMYVTRNFRRKNPSNAVTLALVQPVYLSLLAGQDCCQLQFSNRRKRFNPRVAWTLFDT